MSLDLDILKNYLPILVTIISTLLAFMVGRMSERNKKHEAMLEESLNNLVAKMYKETINISSVRDYDIEEIKNFISNYYMNEELFKLYDEIIINEFLNLFIKIKTDTITEHDLKICFYQLSKSVEKHYWAKLKANTSDFKWFIQKKNINRWFGLTYSILLIITNLLEYILIPMTMLFSLVLLDSVSNDGSGLFSTNIAQLIYALTILFALMYTPLIMIVVLIKEFGRIKRKTLIKKYP